MTRWTMPFVGAMLGMCVLGFATIVFGQCPAQWRPCGDATGPTTGWVKGLAALPGGDVVAVGGFWTIGGVSSDGVARWNGRTWQSLGTGVSIEVEAVAVLLDGSVVAGKASPAGDASPPASIARWNGSAWLSLGVGMQWIGADPQLSIIDALAVLPGGDLVAGGNFTHAGGVAARDIARWNGSAWSSLGSGANDRVRALAVLPNGDLVAGGDFSTAGGIPVSHVARWNGSAWSPLGAGVNDSVFALLALPNGNMIAAGAFTAAGGSPASRIAEWDGSVWHPLSSGLGGTGPYNMVRALTVLPNGDLVAGGFFTTAGGSPASHIARWDGSSWHGLGAGFGSFSGAGITAVAALPDSGIIAGGAFDNAGTTVAHNIAVWQATNADFNHDGSPATDADIEAFFACLSGSCCPTCGSADFNGDGDIGTDQDIDAFFRVLAGGNC